MSQETTKNNLLDRPLFKGCRLTWGWTIYGLILVFIVITRLWDLSSRGYSHDESIHAWESWKLITGQGYQHSPVYHGPFLYHFTALIFGLFGHNDYTARLSPALFGIVLTVLPLFLRKELGKKGLIMATLLMAISPVMMHRSRFLRHDPYVAVFNLIFLIGIVRYLDKPSNKWLYVVAASIALGFTGKETTFITYAIFGVFLAGYWAWQWLQDRSKPIMEMPVFDLLIVIGTLILPLATPFPVRILGGDPIDYTQQGIIFSGAVFLVMMAISVTIGALWDWRRWLVCAGIFFAIFVPFFTTMFTNGQGFATGMVGQLGYWLSQQEVKRGGQPWYYYLVVMPMYEFLPLLVGFGGTIYYFITGPIHFRSAAKASDEESPSEEVSPDQAPPFPFVGLLIFWFCCAFVMYSWAGEKMPWLTMHLALPLQLLGGWTLGKLIEGADWAEIRQKGGLWLLLMVPLFLYTLGAMVFSSPSGGTSTEELSQTMAWGGSLLVALVLVLLISRIAAKLRNRDVWRMLALAVVTLLAAFTVRFAWMATFINADLVSEFLVYAQGTPDVAIVADEIEDLSRRLTGGLHIKVAYDDDSSWPFVWYLRDYDNAQFYGKKPGAPFDAEVVIVGSANESAVKPFLGSNYYRRDYRLIWWPNQDWYMNMTWDKLWEGIKSPERRRAFWNVIMFREHEASLTSWPFVHNFSVHYRRDIAQQVWDFGPEAILATNEPLPGDEYLDVWAQRQAVSVMGSAGAGPGQFQAPKGMAQDADGNLYVADSQNHRIQVLDENGAFLRQWGIQGSGPGQLNEPWSVAIGPDGNVYVADTWNHRIQVYNAQGSYMRSWGIFGEAADVRRLGNNLYGPRDIVFDDDGNLYVTDTGNKRICKYDTDGLLLAAVGGSGAEPGQLLEPVGLAYSDGSIYVADTWNKRIQRFDKALVYQQEWDVHAWDGMSVVNKPYMAVDADGNILVTDPEGYRVLRFDPAGELLGVWGQYGQDMSSFNLPTGLLVDRQGRTLVSDSDNNRILVFAP